MLKKVRWLRRSFQARGTSPLPSEAPPPNSDVSVAPPKTLTISLLTFSQFESCLTLVRSICRYLSAQENLSITIVVRNNNPHLDSRDFDNGWNDLRNEYSLINFKLFNDGFNVGFGQGHNLNFDAARSDFFLILNDDLDLPHMDWLQTALAILENDSGVALVGATETPSSVTQVFGNGVMTTAGLHWPLRYAEASILLARATIFAEIGKFDAAFEWAMCEDADLSFRVQAHGYKLAWLDMPHEHRRSTSFSILPGPTRSSIMEHNRSVLLAKWNVAFDQKRIGRVELLDLWSDGIGDVFCALLHLREYVSSLTEQQRSLLAVNTSSPELARMMLGEQVTIHTIEEKGDLWRTYARQGVRSLRSLRTVNYSVPVNIHALICASLAIPVASQERLSQAVKDVFGDRVGWLRQVGLEGSFCVLHLESERTGHDGRAPTPGTVQEIALAAADHFDHVVLVGKSKLLSVDSLTGRRAEITDLQGTLSVQHLITAIGAADAFVGIDSFPAHVAQAAGIRNAIFFGSVHPSTRVLNEAQTWPIVKPIDCIGCYNKALEPSIPFCMRRDLSCTKDLHPSVLRNAIGGCAELEPFDWRALNGQFIELQRSFLSTILFHPAPERRFLAGTTLSNERASNLLYHVIDRVEEALHESVSQSVLRLAQEVEEARAQSFRKDADLELMKKKYDELKAKLDNRPA